MPNRLIQLSTFEYPTNHAHPLHARFMAHAFAKALNERFLFVVGKGDVEVPHKKLFPRLLPLARFFHIRAFYTLLWFFFFLYLLTSFTTFIKAVFLVIT